MPRSAARPCPRKSSRALGLDPGEEVQAGRVDTPARFDAERHEVRLVAVRLRLLVVVDRRRLAWDCVSALADEALWLGQNDAHVQDPGGPTLDHLDVAAPLVSRGSSSNDHRFQDGLDARHAVERRGQTQLCR